MHGLYFKALAEIWFLFGPVMRCRDIKRAKSREFPALIVQLFLAHGAALAWLWCSS
jgi:hypothetical protein